MRITIYVELYSCWCSCHSNHRPLVYRNIVICYSISFVDVKPSCCTIISNVCIVGKVESSSCSRRLVALEEWEVSPPGISWYRLNPEVYCKSFSRRVVEWVRHANIAVCWCWCTSVLLYHISSFGIVVNAWFWDSSTIESCHLLCWVILISIIKSIESIVCNSSAFCVSSLYIQVLSHKGGVFIVVVSTRDGIWSYSYLCVCCLWNNLAIIGNYISILWGEGKSCVLLHFWSTCCNIHCSSDFCSYIRRNSSIVRCYSALSLFFIQPCWHTTIWYCCDGNSILASAIDSLLAYYTIVCHTSNDEFDIRFSVLCISPGTSLLACYLSVGSKCDWCLQSFIHLCAVQLVRVYDKMVISCQLFSTERLCCLNLLLFCCSDASNRVLCSCIAERACYEPTFFVDIQAMNTHLVACCSVVELCVEYHISLSVSTYYCRVVTLSCLAYCHVAPFVVGTNEFQTSVVSSFWTIVHCVWCVGSKVVVAIPERSCRAGRAEYSHLVTSIRSKSTITHKEVVIVSDMSDIRTLAWNIVSAGNLLAEVCIIASIRACSCSAIWNSIVPETCVLVQFQGVDTSWPGAIDEPQFTIFVIKDIWVDTVRIVCAPALAYIISCWQRSQVSQYQFQVGILVVYFLSAVGVVVEATKDDRSLVCKRSHRAVASHKNYDRCPVVAIQRKVEAPFSHFLVVDNIWCPHVSFYPCRVVRGIYWAVVSRIKAFQSTSATICQFYFMSWVRLESLPEGSVKEIAAILIILPPVWHNNPFSVVDALPVNKVLTLAKSHMRTYDIVILINFIVHYRRVVNADLLLTLGGIQCLQVCFLQSCLCWCPNWAQTHHSD